MGIDRLVPGTFHAQSNYPLKPDDVSSLMETTIDAMDIEEGHGPLVNDAKVVARTRCAEMLEGVTVLTSTVSWLRYATGRVDRKRLKQEHPEIAQYLDGFCHMFRARLALLLYPEKIAELVDILRSGSVQVFRPQVFRDLDQESLKMWFSQNIRNQSGEVDWQLVHRMLVQFYPCGFEYQSARPSFTEGTALSTLRGLADECVRIKGHWHPAYDLERQDKAVYEFITKLEHFRRPALRPDIAYRTDTRPNWFAIAEAMGPEYQSTMVVGHKGEEQQFRSFDDAIGELGDVIRETMQDSWSMVRVSKRNSALYGWFKGHCRTDNGEGVDIQRILQALPADIAHAYAGQAYADTSK